MLQSLGCWTGCFDSVSSGTLHARSDEDEFEAQAPDVDVYTSNASEFVNGVYSLATETRSGAAAPWSSKILGAISRVVNCGWKKCTPCLRGDARTWLRRGPEGGLGRE